MKAYGLALTALAATAFVFVTLPALLPAVLAGAAIVVAAVAALDRTKAG